MAHDEHAHLVHEVEELFKSVLSNSPQAIYIYLDDAHKICNQKFADLLGYKSIQEWVDYETPVSDVSEEDQDKVIKAYGRASEKLEAGQMDIHLNSKNGEKIHVNLIMAPITYKNEVFVIHFISKK